MKVDLVVSRIGSRLAVRIILGHASEIDRMMEVLKRGRKLLSEGTSGPSGRVIYSLDRDGHQYEVQFIFEGQEVAKDL